MIFESPLGYVRDSWCLFVLDFEEYLNDIWEIFWKCLCNGHFDDIRGTFRSVLRRHMCILEDSAIFGVYTHIAE